MHHGITFTEVNLYLHVPRGHLKMMMWKGGDKLGPLKVEILQFGWQLKGGIPSPWVNTGLFTSHGLIDFINCGCKPKGKECSTESCNCHKNNVVFTVYCTCKPYIIRDDAHLNGNEQAEYVSE